MLTNEQVNNFKEIYKKNFGKDLSQGEALDKATRLARLFEIIYQPITQDELDNVLKRKKEIFNN